jgi:hypothetical protein
MNSEYNKYSSIPSGFFRLNFSNLNRFYNSFDLSTSNLDTGTITCATDSYCYSNNKQIACPSGQYYDMTNNSCVATCPTNTMPSYGSLRAVKLSSGFCTNPCNSTPNSGSSCNVDLSNFTSSLTCNIGFTKSHMMCIENSKLNDGALHFSGFFGTQTQITISLPSTMISYYSEFWFYTDRVFNPKPIDSTTNYYIWYTDSIGIVRKNNDKSTYNLVGPDGVLIDSSFTLEYGQWYKIAYYVNQKTGVLNFNRKNLNDKTISYKSDLNLSNIFFCNNQICGPRTDAIKWASGYYRNLKVWNTEYMNANLIKSLDQYWSFLNPPNFKFSNLVRYYPLNIKYSSEKKLRDPLTSGDVTPSGEFTDPYQPWNYSITFDQTTPNNYISSFTLEDGFYTPTLTACPTGCKYCNALECIECLATHMLKAGECVEKTNSKYFLLSPATKTSTTDATDLKFKPITGVTNSITVSFFVKMLSWNTVNESFSIFTYGTGLFLSYNTKTKILYLTDSFTRFASVSNFLSFFGTWINISFSCSYDVNLPTMMNFQVNFENINISNLDSLSTNTFNSIIIPRESVGLYAKIWVAPVYITGPWGIISYKNRSITFTKFIEGGSSTTDCVTTSDLAATADIKCALEHDEILNEANWCASNYAFVNKSTPYCKAAIADCKYGYYTADGLCSYVFDKTIKDSYPTNSSGIIKLYKNEFVDFGQTVSTTITGIGVSSTEYTMEFWIFINNYKVGSFTSGFDLKWNKQMMIKLKYAATKYVSICYPLYDSADITKESANSSPVDISHRTWVYVRCSVSNTLKKYFHLRDVQQVNPLTLNGTPPTVGNDTSFIFSNNSINMGLIFFKQFRLWNCYDCQATDTYKTEITSKSVVNYSAILHVWDPTYSKGTYPPQVTDIKESKNFTPVVDDSWNGYLFVDRTGYKVLSTTDGLIVDNSSPGIVSINDFDDMSLPASASTTGRYTIELWVVVTDLGKLNNGFHIIWRNLISLSFSKSTTDSTTFNTYCWPLDYQLDISSVKGNANIENQAKTYLNDKFVKTSYADKSWFSVRCALSHNMNQFYINTNTVQNLQSNLMWKNQRTDAPFRYMWQNGAKTNLIITGANLNTNTNIYIRQIMLYNDYLPQLFTFQNHDMSKLTSSTMKSQIFSISLLSYKLALNQFSYTDDATANLIYTPTIHKSVISLSLNKSLTLVYHCDPTKNEKFSDGSCNTITSCNTSSLKVLYCQNENTPLICAEDYHWDETKFKTDASTACTQTCSNSYIRSPDSNKKGAFCNFKCDANASCPSTSADQLDLANKYTCNSGCEKVGYKCLDSATSSKNYLYFNGCYNFPNIGFDFNSRPDSKFENGHIIQFWIKIDRFNEFCSTNKRKYYFIMEPHTIYLDTTSNTFAQTGATVPSGFYNIVYQNINNTDYKGSIFSFNPNTWNVITIQVNLVNRSLKVFSNYNFITPDIKIENIPTSVKLELTKLVFCSTQGKASDNSLCSTASYANDLSWGAAFYRDIKIWDGVNATPWLIQENDNKSFSETLSSYLYYFPMSVKYSSNSNIQNVLRSGGGMDYMNRYPNLTPDKDLIINYSSKSEFTDINPGKYMNSFELSGGSYTSSDCPSNCVRCIANSPQACLECVAGYKLYSNMCKKYTGYYLKVPVSTSKTFLSLRVDDTSNGFTLSKENILTWSIWIKYFGQISSSSSCITIIRLKADGSRYICYNPTTTILYFYDGTNILYQDTTFNSYIGQWVLLSFSSFMNNPPIIPNLGEYFSHQYAFYVQDQEVSKLSTYSVPAPGIGFDVFDIGYEFSGLLADFRVYRDFIVNPYGYILTGHKITNLLINLPLSAEKSTGTCMNDQSLNLSTYKSSITVTTPNTSYTQQIGVACLNDYLPQVSAECPDYSFFDHNKLHIMDLPCTTCPSNCSRACGSADPISCTCNFNAADNWLKTDPATKKLTCESPSYLDYSRGSMNINNVKVANNREYSIEFWFYIHSYNNSTIAFDSHEVIWDLHNYIKIYKNDKNGISVRCSPVYDSRNRNLYIGSDVNSFFGPSDNGYDDFYVESSTKSNDGFSIGSYYQWVYFQCSTSVPRKIYQVNQKVSTTINYKDEDIPDLRNYNTTSLLFQPGNKAKANYGFLFFREIKLWSQYDIRHFWTTCKPGANVLQYYNYTLLNYFINDKAGTKMTDSLDSKVIGFINKRSDFVGFNAINIATKNSTIFPTLEECSEMNIFPSTGFANSTTFSIQSREVQQVLTNKYRFYYRIKDTDDEIQIENESSIRETKYKFNILSELFGTQIGALSNDTLMIEVFCDINFVSGRKITLFKSLILYKELKFDSGLSYDKLLSNADLNDQITNSQILSRAEVLNDLQTDLKGAFTQDPPATVRMNLTSNATDINPVQSSSIAAKSIVTSPSCSAYSNYCNNRGICYNVGINLFCKCLGDFSGLFCQMSKNNSITWMNMTNKLVDMFNYRTSNSSSFEVDQNLVSSINTLFNSSSKLIDVGDTNQVKNLKNLMNSLANSTSAMSKDVIKNSMDNFVNIANTMFKTNIKNFNQQKYNTINNMVLNSNTSALKNINLKIQYVNLTSLGSSSSSKRILQESIDTNVLTDPNMSYVLNFDDSTENIPLSREQQDFYSETTVEVKNYMQTILMSAFNATNFYEPFEYLKKYDEFQVLGKKITDINNFDFKAYFSNLNRTSDYDAFFDAGDCLREFSNNSTLNENMYDLSRLLMMYIESKIPERKIRLENNGTFISTTHTIKFFDSNLKEIKLRCNKGVTHYLPLKIYLQNTLGQAWMTDLTAYADKYTTENYHKNYFIAPFYIYPNGTIDHSETTVQLNKYYRNYNIRILFFNETTQSYEYNGILFNQVNPEGYLIGTSNHLSEFTSALYYEPVTPNYQNHYFMKYMPIYTCIENAKGNMCFYIVVIFFVLHILVLLGISGIQFILLFIRKENITVSFKNEYNAYIQERNKDNYKFGDNRHESPSNEVYQQAGRKHVKYTENNNVISLGDEKDEKEGGFEIAAQKPKVSVNNDKGDNIPEPVKSDKWEIKELHSTPAKLNLKSADEDVEKMSINNFKSSENNKIELNVQNNKEDAQINVISVEIDSETKIIRKSYNIFYFILSRCIYANVLSSSPFAPKYKAFSKLVFLVYSQMLIVCVFCAFFEMDLTVNIFLFYF